MNYVLTLTEHCPPYVGVIHHKDEPIETGDEADEPLGIAYVFQDGSVDCACLWTGVPYTLTAAQCLEIGTILYGYIKEHVEGDSDE